MPKDIIELSRPIVAPAIFLCEAEVGPSVCANKATTEWRTVDEDGDTFYTYRCDDHPHLEPTYHDRELGDMPFACFAKDEADNG